MERKEEKLYYITSLHEKSDTPNSEKKKREKEREKKRKRKSLAPPFMEDQTCLTLGEQRKKNELAVSLYEGQRL